MLQLTFAKCRRSYSSTSPDKTIIARLSDDNLKVAQQLEVEVAELGSGGILRGGVFDQSYISFIFGREQRGGVLLVTIINCRLTST